MPRSITPLTLTEYRALVAGIPLYCASAIFTVAGQTFTAAQATAYINGVLSAVAATATAKGAWKEAILAEQKIVAQDGETVKQIRNNVALMFSNQVNTLTAFAIAPRKVPVPLTAAKRAAAIAKAKATRLARGTTSKKQKAALTGDVTGVTITPVTSSAVIPAAPPLPVATAVPVLAPATPPALPAAPVPAGTAAPATHS